MRIITKEPEASLVELLNLLEPNRREWLVVCFNFSQLLEHYRSEYQLKIATNLMNDLLGDRDGAIYLCDDATIFIAGHGVQKSLLEKMIFQLRYLFVDDPLAYTPEGEENPAFVTRYDMDSQWQEVLDLCKKRLVARVINSRGGAGAAVGAAVRAAVERENKSAKVALAPAALPLTASTLIDVESALKGVDLTPAIRRQPICALTPDTKARAVYDEMYLNIAHVRDIIRTDVDLLSNRWLFKYLTQVLDERMLDAIQRDPTRYLIMPFSLNLNVQTVLSARFQEFDAAIKPGSKVSIVVEFQIADVFADMQGYLLASESLQKHGYRVCLDGVSVASFVHIDRARLGFDLLKLQWNADTETDLRTDQNRKLGEAIRLCGASRVILNRCDDQRAVRFGQALGLSLFQGRHLDRLVNPKSTVKN